MTLPVGDRLRNARLRGAATHVALWILVVSATLGSLACTNVTFVDYTAPLLTALALSSAAVAASMPLLRLGGTHRLAAMATTSANALLLLDAGARLAG